MRDVNDNVDARGKSRVQTVNDEPSETVQSDAHLADIANIMKQYGLEGQQMLDETQLVYADISEFTDLADALNQAKQAEVEFLKLPGPVQEIFEHSVAVWLDTAHDEEKRDALVEAGFLKSKDHVEESMHAKSTQKPPEPPAIQPPIAPEAPA